jgi:hypothetical protein
MAKNPDVAAFQTTTEISTIAKANQGKASPPPPGKYKEFMDAIHSVAYSDKNIDEQTELGWDNIEGEVMACVLTDDLLSGTMFVPVRNRMFRFKSVETQVNELFIKKFIEVLNHHPYMVPAITVGRKKLNELMVSYQRAGRTELVEMIRAFQISLQDSSKMDDMQRMLRR